MPHIYTHAHIYIYTCIHTYTHVPMHTHIHTRLHAHKIRPKHMYIRELSLGRAHERLLRPSLVIPLSKTKELPATGTLGGPASRRSCFPSVAAAHAEWRLRAFLLSYRHLTCQCYVRGRRPAPPAAKQNARLLLAGGRSPHFCFFLLTSFSSLN